MLMSAIEAATTEPAIRGRGRVLREARVLFTAQGYAAVSMQQIADAAAMNKATLYHHFRDKEDLFVAVMAEEFGLLGVLMLLGVYILVIMRGMMIALNAQDSFGRLLAASITTTCFV